MGVVVGGDILALIPMAQLSAGRMGPILIGTALDLFFVGILCCQVWNYYTNFPNDRTWIKRLVALVFVLSVIKAAISTSIIWEKVVASVHAQGAATYSWNLQMSLPMTAVITATAQSFFVWRCFNLIGRNWYLLATLTIIMLSTIGFAIAIAFYRPHDAPGYPKTIAITIPMLVNSIVVDVVITVIVLYKLSRSLREGFSGKTDTALKRLRVITFESASPPAVNQVINLIVLLKASGGQTWHAQLNLLSCRLYVFSLMYTLNARASIRSEAAAETIALYTSSPTPRAPSGNELGNSTSVAKPSSNKNEQPNKTVAARRRTETAPHSASR